MIEFNHMQVPRIRAVVSVTIALAGLPFAGMQVQSAEETQTRTYVMSSIMPALYPQEGDCRSLEPAIDDGYGPVESLRRRILIQAGKTPLEAHELLTKSPADLTNLTANRGWVGSSRANVYQNPESVPDPKFNKIIGRYAIGFNLDGLEADSLAAFEDPFTHEKGIDNQFFRLMGCIRSMRVMAPEHPISWDGIVREYLNRSPAWLISIDNRVGAQQGDVTLTFGAALERTQLDARGDVRRNITFRMNPDPRTRSLLRGRIKDGEAAIDSGELTLATKSIVNPFDMTNVHLRLKVKADGSLEGTLGGYQTWQPMFYSYYGRGAPYIESYGIDVPGVYHGMKELADADPDPVSGQNRRISITYLIEAVPAFVVPAHTKRSHQALSASASERARTFTHSAARQESVSSGGPSFSRRLTERQYERVVNEVFGIDVDLSGRFEVENRNGIVGGLAAIGAAQGGISATGIEHYDIAARTVAAKVVEEGNRSLLLPCVPAVLSGDDTSCATKILTAVGSALYRRPLSAHELQGYVGIAESASLSSGGFYRGIELAIAGLLESFPFLFRQEAIEPDPDHAGHYRLDAFSKASRLSFLLWDAAPDPVLLEAAASGEIHSTAGLARQVARLLASSRLEDGIRAFFSDMLHLDLLSTVSKDGLLYPAYTADVARDAREQTLRTVVDHLLKRGGDYRDLFTTRRTFLTPLLASVYGVPMSTDAALGEWNVWQSYEYSEGDPRSGILTHLSFLAVHSHPGRTSPTLRGKALREVVLCEKVPDPPPNVNQNLEETAGTALRTMREKLHAHAAQPMCAGCHRITDPLGLALENFDTAGGYRETDGGAAIDAGGKFNGRVFRDIVGMKEAVRDYPGAASCVVDKLYAYGVGRLTEKGEAKWLAQLKKDFADSGYRIPELLWWMTTSEAFYRVLEPAAADWRGENDSQSVAREVLQ